jgi:hypothetical protein
VEGVQEPGAFFHLEITKAVGKIVTVSHPSRHSRVCAESVTLHFIVQDRSPEVRIQVALCVEALAKFSNNYSSVGLEPLLSMAVKGLDDQSPAVLEVFAHTLGTLLSLSVQASEAAEAAAASARKEAERQNSTGAGDDGDERNESEVRGPIRFGSAHPSATGQWALLKRTRVCCEFRGSEEKGKEEAILRPSSDLGVFAGALEQG